MPFPEVLEHPPEVLEHPPEVLEHPPEVLEHPLEVLEHPPEVLEHPRKAREHPLLRKYYSIILFWEANYVYLLSINQQNKLLFLIPFSFLKELVVFVFKSFYVQTENRGVRLSLSKPG